MIQNPKNVEKVSWGMSVDFLFANDTNKEIAQLVVGNYKQVVIKHPLPNLATLKYNYLASTAGTQKFLSLGIKESLLFLP